jgi:hypothetical protein
MNTTTYLLTTAVILTLAAFTGWVIGECLTHAIGLMNPLQFHHLLITPIVTVAVITLTIVIWVGTAPYPTV